MAEPQIIDPREAGYFLAGLLPDQQKALTFRDYLNSRGIKALAYPTMTEAWGIYVVREADVSRAKLELLRFADNPFAKEFNAPAWQKGGFLKREKVIRGSGSRSWQPFTVISIIEILCVLIFAVGFLSPAAGTALLAALSFVSLEQVTSGFELWRLFTPALLHFGFLHIAFNLVMFEALGRPLERGLGKGRVLYLILIIALISNLLQLGFSTLSSPYELSVFGGMSGVVYGLIGYMGVLSTRPDVPYSLRIPKGLMTVCLVFIVFGFFLSGIANFCHLGGMLTGALLGLIDKKKLRFA